MNKKKKEFMEFIQHVGPLNSSRKEVQKVKDLLEEISSHEAENFIFVGQGDGQIVQGMHYPDSAFDDLDPGKFPMIISTMDPGVFIAMWPSSFLLAAVQELENSFPKEEIEERWQQTIQLLMEDAVKVLENREEK